METTVLFQIEQDIACGKYACLQSCCASEGALADIYRLMHMLGETDISRLSKMLCGCAVRPQSGTITNDPTKNCSDTVIKYACQSQNTLRTIRNVLAASVPLLPAFAIVTGPIALLLQDVLSACETGGSSVVDSIMDRLCTFNAWLRSVSLKALPDSLGSVVDALLQWTVLLPLTGCCDQHNVANTWPDISSLPNATTTNPSGSQTTPTVLTSTPSNPSRYVPQIVEVPIATTVTGSYTGN